MYYSKIYGHFNFEFLYEEMVDKFDSGSSFVEIGAYLGKSTCFLAEKLIMSGKDIKLSVIDNWSSHSTDVVLNEEIKKFGDIYAVFNNNMQMAGVIDKLDIVRADSVESASMFQDHSVDFVFIDAAHDYESVKNDIAAWFPKVKVGGVIAGHDYENDEPTGVEQAVDERFGDKIRVIENVWRFDKGEI